ncbi:hypothetical protein [Bradyrhizobium sp. USDA 10063]
MRKARLHPHVEYVGRFVIDLAIGDFDRPADIADSDDLHCQ